jgi:hypothetical protein
MEKVMKEILIEALEEEYKEEMRRTRSDMENVVFEITDGIVFEERLIREVA